MKYVGNKASFGIMDFLARDDFTCIRRSQKPKLLDLNKNPSSSKMSIVYLPFQVHNFPHTRLETLQSRGSLNIITSHYLGGEPRNHSSLNQISQNLLSALKVKLMNAHMPATSSSCGH